MSHAVKKPHNLVHIGPYLDAVNDLLTDPLKVSMIPSW